MWMIAALGPRVFVTLKTALLTYLAEDFDN